jgi:D-methionine transport system substrate-binding protein
MANSLPDKNGSRGFAVRRRRRWPWLVGGVAAVAIIAGGVVALRTAGTTSTIEEPGAVLKVAYFDSDSAEQALIGYVSQTLAPAHGIKVEGVSIGDSTQINRAVSQGQIAGTVFQHRFWLGQVLAANPSFKEEPGTGPIFHWVFGVWSQKYAHLADIPDGASISLPADPANEAQALWLLENAGLIKIKDGVQRWTAGLADIQSNPHSFHWVLLDLGAQPRGLQSLDAAVGYAESFLSAKLPEKDLIYSPRSPDQFASVLTVGSRFKNSDNIRKLIETFEDPLLQAFIATDPRTKPMIQPAATAGTVASSE